MVFLNYLLYFLIFSIFVFAPFDTILNINILGFNFRLVGFLVILFIIVGLTITLRNFLKDKAIIIPTWWILLAIVCLLNTVFILNSILLVRGIMYSLWFWVFVLMVISFINLSKQLDPIILVKLYMFSFIFHALFGIAQQISYYTFNTPLLATQPGRINGFTYEPSYFATYLSPSIILLLLYAIFIDAKNIKSNLIYYLSVCILITALIISTSKVLIVGLILSIVFATIFLTLFAFRNKLSKLLNLTWLNLIMIAVVSSIIFTSTYTLLNYTPKSKKEITIDKKFQEISENKEETSFGPRIEEFKKTLKVALENPIIGTSLGGVAPHKALREGITPKSNQDVKPYEGMSIYAEMLAAFGVIGFIIMAGFLIILMYDSTKISLLLLSKNMLTESVILFSLISGLLIELAILSFNQNILRFYLWNQIAVLGLVLENFRLKTKTTS